MMEMTFTLLLIALSFLVQDSSANCTISSNEIVLSNSSNFLNYTQPQFTLYGRTIGGEPTSFSWSRDGVMLEPTKVYTINNPILSRGTGSCAEFIYQSSLTVSGRLPGVYKYIASNSQTSGQTTSSLEIQTAAAPLNLTLRQNGQNSVEVSWTAPTSPPSMGYAIAVTEDLLFDIYTTSTSYIFGNLPAGMNLTVWIVSRSQHFGSDILGPMSLVLLGLLEPSVSVLAVTSSSATISLSQPVNSLPAELYIVTLTKTADSLCRIQADVKTGNSNTGTVLVERLDEHTVYSVSVMTRIDTYNLATNQVSLFLITTLSDIPSAAPTGLAQVSITSRTVMLRWEEISCRERNGVITSYDIKYGPVGGTLIIRNTEAAVTQFTVDGLTPYTNYSFQLAGVNVNGSGPYTNILEPLTTLEDVPGPVVGFTGTTTFFTVDLIWSPPEAPNGFILGYNITYRVNGSSLLVTDTISATSDPQNYTIAGLYPRITVSDISISAFTSRGSGLSTEFSDTFTTQGQPSVVSNVQLQMLADNSIRVSWDRLQDSMIAHYIVYYSQSGDQASEAARIVPSTDNFVDVVNLVGGGSYSFQVVAQAILGEVLQSERSSALTFSLERSTTLETSSTVQSTFPNTLSSLSTFAPANSSNVIAIVITALIVFIVTVMVYSLVLVIVLLIWCSRRTKGVVMTPEYLVDQKSKYGDIMNKDMKNADEHLTYDVIPNKYQTPIQEAVEMSDCVAYGKVPTTDGARPISRRLTPSITVAGGTYEDYTH